MDREFEHPLDVPRMAHEALMSPAHFARQFKLAYGETPYGYLMTRRIERPSSRNQEAPRGALTTGWCHDHLTEQHLRDRP